MSLVAQCGAYTGGAVENVMAGLARFAIRFRYFIIAFWIIAGAACAAFVTSLFFPNVPTSGKGLGPVDVGH